MENDDGVARKPRLNLANFIEVHDVTPMNACELRRIEPCCDFTEGPANEMCDWAYV
jgi:hypothetical protein